MTPPSAVALAALSRSQPLPPMVRCQMMLPSWSILMTQPSISPRESSDFSLEMGEDE